MIGMTKKAKKENDNPKESGGGGGEPEADEDVYDLGAKQTSGWVVACRYTEILQPETGVCRCGGHPIVHFTGVLERGEQTHRGRHRAPAGAGSGVQTRLVWRRLLRIPARAVDARASSVPGRDRRAVNQEQQGPGEFRSRQDHRHLPGFDGSAKSYKTPRYPWVLVKASAVRGGSLTRYWVHRRFNPDRCSSGPGICKRGTTGRGYRPIKGWRQGGG